MDFTLYGKRVYKSTGKYTEREAKIAEAKEMERIEDEMRNPHLQRPKPDIMTLSAAVEKCYNERWKYNRDGLGSYSKAKRIVKLIGDKKLDEIEHQDLMRLRKQLERTGIEASTINRYLATLRTIMYMALREWKVIYDTPTFKLQKEPEGRIREISKDEENKILGYFYRNNMIEMGDLIVCLIDTGMRLSEMLNLKFKDIDFETRLIRIWKNKADHPRSVPMTTRVLKILTKRREETWLSSPFQLNVDQTEKLWKKVRKELKLESDPDFVIHTLRHTCACRLVRAGVSLIKVQKWLGHKSIKTTERYAHIVPEDLLDVVDRLEG